METPGKTFRRVLAEECPLQIVGTVNAMTALIAKQTGFKAIYLSGAGVANASFGLPDLGITTLNDVLEDTRRITNAVDLPLLVDIDTGFGSAFNIARTVRDMIKAGAAGIHIEDQVQAKRCGHRPKKSLVSIHEMGDRLKTAIDAKTDPDFVIMARTDALANEGLETTLERIHHYIAVGADMIFFEGVTDLNTYQALSRHCTVPILANITEFGVTPLFTQEALAAVGVQIILYPLSAFRAMNKAAENVYRAIRDNGTQEKMVAAMQTRTELYTLLDYYAYENTLDKLFAKGETHE